MSDANVREAIERVSASIAADPSKARANNAPATARLLHGLLCEITGPNSERLMADMPKGVGGEASAPNPGWLLRGSLASCTAITIAMRAARLGVTLTGLEVTAESESDNRGMLGLDDSVHPGLGGVRLKVKIAGDAPADTLRDIVEWADAHSVVGSTVRQATNCTLEIEA